VDNLCHSLVGAAMSGAGLRRRTGLATVTLVLGANLPDADALLYLFEDGTSALAFRRGWTHGLLAMAVLPALLAVVMVGVGRLLERRRARLRRPTGRIPIRPAQLLLLAALSVWTHPLLDLLNTYGVRLLMPFSGRWFYGDALFIVDPWVWLALGIGATISLRRARAVPVGAGTATVMRRVERPARIALSAVAIYIVAMAASSVLGRVVVERQARAAGGAPAQRVMVAPEPVQPFTRDVVRDLGDAYEVGRLTWSVPPRYVSSRAPFANGLARAPAREAARDPHARDFLSWSRFPYADVSAAGDSVRFEDARYAVPGQMRWAGVSVPLPSPATDSR